MFDILLYCRNDIYLHHFILRIEKQMEWTVDNNALQMYQTTVGSTFFRKRIHTEHADLWKPSREERHGCARVTHKLQWNRGNSKSFPEYRRKKFKP